MWQGLAWASGRTALIVVPFGDVHGELVRRRPDVDRARGRVGVHEPELLHEQPLSLSTVEALDEHLLPPELEPLDDVDDEPPGRCRREAHVHPLLHLHLVRHIAAGQRSKDAVCEHAGLDRPASALVRRHLGEVSELRGQEAALLELQRHLLVRFPARHRAGHDERLPSGRRSSAGR